MRDNRQFNRKNGVRRWWRKVAAGAERRLDAIRLRWARRALKRPYRGYEQMLVLVPVAREVIATKEVVVMSAPLMPASSAPEVPVAEAVCEAEVRALARYANQSVDELELGVYPKQTCKDAGIRTIGQLVSYTDGELRAMKCGFGEYTVEQEIKPALDKIGLRLGMRKEVEALRSA